MHDRYGTDVLAGNWRRPNQVTRAPAQPGLVVEEAASGFCGAVVRAEFGTVELEDRHRARRVFPLGHGFLIDGKPVELTQPLHAPKAPARSASGSISVSGTRAQVAKASRLLVEGRHDAELVEKIWGYDLRIEGVVVEILDGVDNLAAAVREFQPGPKRRLGVLVDHLVPGSKESRLAAAHAADPHILVVGHPFVDVWQSVKPARLGLDAWPVIGRDVEWKHGICAALGWPHAAQADIAQAWRRILDRVETYTDLEPELLGRVEELIDFVTA